MTRSGELEIGAVSCRLPDNPGGLSWHVCQGCSTINFAAIATEAHGLSLQKMADAESYCLKNETTETLLEL